MSSPRVVILGGGFAGLAAARRLRRAPVDVTVVDRRNFHLFQPLLYQVATGGLSPAEISSPIRAVLKRQRNARVLLAEAIDLDAVERRLRLDCGDVPYDALIVATGGRHHYFGHAEWESRAPGLKTVEDATRIRSRILEAFERAERATDAAEREGLLTFVIVGGGATGVELAGAIGELADHTLVREFRNIDTGRTRILLVEGYDRVLPSYPPPLSMAARKSLERLGVEVLVGTRVTKIDDRGVRLEGQDGERQLRSANVLWAAGVQGSGFGRILERRAGATLDRAGRVLVEPDCSVPGHPEIAVVGDLACFEHQTGSPLPGVAPVANQQGSYAARRVLDRLAGRSTPPFRYRNRGNLAVIGRAAAVADLGRLRFSGYPAWLLWLFIHIMYLVEFENRVLVFVQWAFSYFSRKRGARLITGERDGGV